jgi:hypothetical protein
MMKRAMAGVALILALGGCGARGTLRPADGETLPVAPYGAVATPSPTDLLQPPVQTRPKRSDDLIESSGERRGDKFDLPPP